MGAPVCRACTSVNEHAVVERERVPASRRAPGTQNDQQWRTLSSPQELTWWGGGVLRGET